MLMRQGMMTAGDTAASTNPSISPTYSTVQYSTVQYSVQCTVQPHRQREAHDEVGEARHGRSLHEAGDEGGPGDCRDDDQDHSDQAADLSTMPDRFQSATGSISSPARIRITVRHSVRSWNISNVLFCQQNAIQN